MNLQYIIEHIEEFACYIKTDTINRILDELDLNNTIYSIKYMIRTGKGSALKDIVILIYRHFILIGVCIIEDKKIVHQNSSLTGIDINDYLPKYLKSEHELPPSKEAQLYKNTLLKELNIPYDNKLTTLEKLDLLQEYINDETFEEKQLKKEIAKAHYQKYKKDKKPSSNSKEYQREYQKKYREKLKEANKDKPKVERKLLTEEQKKINEINSKKKYYQKNKEKISDYMKDLREEYKQIKTNNNNENN